MRIQRRIELDLNNQVHDQILKDLCDEVPELVYDDIIANLGDEKTVIIKMY